MPALHHPDNKEVLPDVLSASYVEADNLNKERLWKSITPANYLIQKLGPMGLIPNKSNFLWPGVSSLIMADGKPLKKT